MKPTPQWTSSLILWLFACSAIAGMAEDHFIVGNELISRTLSIADGHLRTTEFRDLRTGRALPVESQEFLLRFDDRELTTNDFRFTGEVDRYRAYGGSTGESGADVVFTLESRCGVELGVADHVEPGKPYMRKRLMFRREDRPSRTWGKLRLPKDPRLLTEGQPSRLLLDVQVERFRVREAAELGGLGQPVFVGDAFFAGVEYPAADNLQQDGLVTLEHHPGAPLTRLRWDKSGTEGYGPGKFPVRWSHSAVIGLASGGDVEAGFAEYLSDIRRTPRSIVVYNSWYDMREGELTVPALVNRQREIHRELVEKRGTRLDSLVIDDGWQNRKSIWEFDPAGFPKGFDELHDALEGTATEIGLWHPLTPINGNLDTDWAAANGYEVSPDRRFFCLSGPRYGAELTSGLLDKVGRYDINYLKHDFNYFACAAEGHGHLPDPAHGREANVDAELRVYEALSAQDPDVYINPSSGMWLSPWWLTHVDTVWMRHCADFGHEKSVPALEPRDWAMTYRDSRLYRNLRVDRVQFPLSAIMTIGVIDGKLNRLGGKDEPLGRWIDNVMDNVCRGSMLLELYITPSLLDDQQWDALARAIRWQERFLSEMATGTMIGGDPAKGEVYGYLHAGDDKGVLCLRNPDMDEQSFSLQLPGSGAWRPVVVYPYCQALPEARGSEALTLDLGPHELIVVELWRPGAMGCPILDGRRYSVESVDDGQLRCRVYGAAAPVTVRRFSHTPSEDEEQWVWTASVPEGNTAEFVVLLQGPASGSHAGDFRLSYGGGELAPQTTEGSGWVALSADVPAGSAGKLCLERRAERAPAEPFASDTYTFSARLITERSLPSEVLTVPLSPDVNGLPVLPATPLAGMDRESLTLVPPATAAPFASRQALRAGELAQATAGKLHIAVFGSQGGDDYGRKHIVLNGQRIAQVPVNTNAAEPDRWEEFVIDLAPEHVSLLSEENAIAVETDTGDCFKFGDLALAIRLPDGTWVETIRAPGVFTQPRGWLHFEGTAFEGRSPDVVVSFGRAPNG